jgi:hypothetical protein
MEPFAWSEYKHTYDAKRKSNFGVRLEQFVKKWENFKTESFILNVVKECLGNDAIFMPHP